MNFLKSMYISNYMMLAMSIMSYSGWMLYQGADPIAWGGVLLTVAPMMMMIGRLMMFKNVARTSSHFPLISLQGLVGVGLTAMVWKNDPTEIQSLLLASVGLVTFLIYAYWYSSFGRKPNSKIEVGSRLPAFKLKDSNGTIVNSNQLMDRPVILIFYRGNWCPLCMAQVKELAKRYREISELGVRVALISPQPHKNTVALANKFKVKFKFFTDTGNLAARSLGIALPNGLPFGMNMMGYDTETVLPTVIIADQNGTVIWTHETDNYRIRPEPDVYLDVLRHHGLTLMTTA